MSPSRVAFPTPAGPPALRTSWPSGKCPLTDQLLESEQTLQGTALAHKNTPASDTSCKSQEPPVLLSKLL